MTVQLPCECGSTVGVSMAQAGSSAACGCGRSVTVPSFRELKGLAELQPKRNPLSKNLNGAEHRRRIFVAGIVCVMGTLLIETALFVPFIGQPLDDFTFNALTMARALFLLLYFVGMFLLTQAKGYPPWSVLLFSLFFPVGLGFLIFMPGRED